MSLNQVNLNLLLVLRELLSRRSVSAAGTVLGRSPSAISQSLRQLRGLLGDPLLVRIGGRMVLTEQALSLIEPVEEACATIETLLQPNRFSPTTVQRVFVIAATDSDSFTSGPAIVDAFRVIAPGVRVRFVEIGRDLGNQMIDRTVDFALMPDFLLPELSANRTRHRIVAESPTVALMRADHPLAALQVVPRADLTRFQHIALFPSWETFGRRPALHLERLGLPTTANVAHSVVIPAFVARTGDIALVPLEMAERLGPSFGLTYRAVVPAFHPVKSVLAWSVLQDADPAHRWFVDTAAAALRSPAGAA